MRRSVFVLAWMVMACALLTPGVGQAQEQAPRLEIRNVTVDLVSGMLTISGTGFPEAPVVTLDGQPMTVLPGVTSSQIVVMAPAAVIGVSGTYRLTVVDLARGLGDAFVVAVVRAGEVTTGGTTAGAAAAATGAALPATQPTVTVMTTTGQQVAPQTQPLTVIEESLSPFRTALGYQALASNIPGSGGIANVAVGYQAAQATTGGTSNVAVGYSALLRNTSGGGNVGIGTYALESNLTGSRNIGIGLAALDSNSGGQHNVGIGDYVLAAANATDNVAVGFEAGRKSTNGTQNTAVGSEAFHENTTGDWNTSVGYRALYSSTSGGNTAVGWLAGTGITTGGLNTSLGWGAGSAVTTGSSNIHIGAWQQGNAADTYTTRIGLSQSRTFVAGIYGVNVGTSLPVVIDSDNRAGHGQLQQQLRHRDVHVVRQADRPGAGHHHQPGAQSPAVEQQRVRLRFRHREHRLWETRSLRGAQRGPHASGHLQKGRQRRHRDAGAERQTDRFGAGHHDWPGLQPQTVEQQRVRLRFRHREHLLWETRSLWRAQRDPQAADHVQEGRRHRHRDDGADQPPGSLGGGSGQAPTYTNATIVANGGDHTHGVLGQAATAGYWGGVFYNAAGSEVLLASGGYAALLTGGNVGIGTKTPTNPLEMGSGAYVSTGGVWTNASSRTFKQNIADLPLERALAAIEQLAPVTYQYKASPGEHHVGFIAEDVPELVGHPRSQEPQRDGHRRSRDEGGAGAAAGPARAAAGPAGAASDDRRVEGAHRGA